MINMAIPLYEKIYQHILHEIKSGVLKEGDRIPTELELADQFHVSRITTKKSLEILAKDGLIERHRGRGSYVSSNLPELHSLAATEEMVDLETPSSDDWRLIAVILPDFSESYGTKLLRAIERQCSKLRIRMILKLTHDLREEEEIAIRTLVNMGIDGLIVYPIHGEHYNGELLKLVLNEFPLVLLDRYLKGINACSVCTNNKKAAQELTDYLLDKHHKHIAFVSTPPENTSTIEERIHGYTDALLHRGVGIDQQYFITNLSATLPNQLNKDSNIMEDREIISQFIMRNPQITAFVVGEYLLAIHLRQVLIKLGLLTKYEIVCFDSPDDLFEEPLFSFIRQNEEEMGINAVNLMQMQWDRTTVPKKTLVAHSFVKRMDR
ncbi:GntR family transcriptional regulator [Paenibacillus sp. LMG 31460]|uniref:GntR family transcriptional regulator n=2 Tax=Paenibacillus germinis TaxID=2654979 RepID=A0ABX1ZA59_9BACL|nr:GntR family transcriptional regulator [Paenibacillus germinis]